MYTYIYMSTLTYTDAAIMVILTANTRYIMIYLGMVVLGYHQHLLVLRP